MSENLSSSSENPVKESTAVSDRKSETGLSSDMKLSIIIGVVVLLGVAFMLFRNSGESSPAATAVPSTEEVVKTLEAEVGKNPNANTYFRLGFVYINVKAFDKSVAANKKAIEFQPEFADAYLNLGMAYMGLNQPDSAIIAFEKVLSINPDYQLAKNNLKWAKDEAAKQVAQ